MLKMRAYTAHSRFLVSSFAQSVADDPKKGLPSFSCRSYLHIMRQWDPHKNEKTVTVKKFRFRFRSQVSKFRPRPLAQAQYFTTMFRKHGAGGG